MTFRPDQQGIAILGIFVADLAFRAERLPALGQTVAGSGFAVGPGGKESLARYYTAGYGSVRFDRSLAENVVFADHSLATDQVFAEVHVVVCRNVLIYFDRVLKDHTLTLFSESLATLGVLCLGRKESLRFTALKRSANCLPSFRFRSICTR